MKQFPHRKHTEFNIFKKLNSPSKIQDFLDNIPINFELHGETYRSPLFTLRHNEAHCMEGALLAAAMLWYHGEKPLIIDLNTIEQDENHVITLFKRHNRWGAISKTNHATLRYRDPVYKSVRELALSYFNEYFLDNGAKTLRSYSRPFNLTAYNPDWVITDKDAWDLVEKLDYIPHFDLFTSKHARILRPADAMEIKMGKLVEWGNINPE